MCHIRPSRDVQCWFQRPNSAPRLAMFKDFNFQRKHARAQAWGNFATSWAADRNLPWSCVFLVCFDDPGSVSPAKRTLPKFMKMVGFVFLTRYDWPGRMDHKAASGKKNILSSWSSAGSWQLTFLASKATTTENTAFCAISAILMSYIAAVSNLHDHISWFSKI